MASYIPNIYRFMPNSVILKLRYLFTMVSIVWSLEAFPSMFTELNLEWSNVYSSNYKLTTFCIYKDTRGLIWLGTDKGLFFYDGFQMHRVREEDTDGLCVYSIIELEDNLFLGTNNGLFKYDIGKNQYGTPLKNTPIEIRTLLLCENRIWIGSLYGMYSLNPETLEITECSQGLYNKSVYSLIRDSRGIIYAGTYDGLSRWDEVNRCFHSVPLLKSIEFHGNFFVNSMTESQDRQKIYIGVKNHLYIYYPRNDSWENYPLQSKSNIKCLTVSHSGDLLIGTEDGLLACNRVTAKHYQQDSRSEYSIADNEIWCIYCDDTDNLWLGHNKGISLAVDHGRIRHFRLSSLIDSSDGMEIHSIFRDHQGNLWIGGSNGVIRDPIYGEPKWYKHDFTQNALSHNKVRAIHQDTDNNLFFATDDGVNRYDYVLDRFYAYHLVDPKNEHMSNWVYAIADFKDSYLIGGYLMGVQKVSKEKLVSNNGGKVVSDKSLNMSPNEFGTKPISLRNDLVNNVITDSVGNIWILLFRDNILTKIDTASNTTEYNIYELIGRYPTHMIMDKHQRVWCGFKGGCAVVDEDGNLLDFYFPRTDVPEDILAMDVVENDIWLATTNNLWKINCESFEIELLPLPSRKYTCIYADPLTHMVLLGGQDEIVEVDPDIVYKSVPPSSFKLILENRDSIGDLVHLTPPNSKFELPYRGGLSLIISDLDYSPLSSKRYLYKLAKSKEDTIGDWIILPEGVNTISFSELSFGHYFLLLKTAGNPFDPVCIPINVAVPWSLSWWSISLYVLMLFCLIGVIITFMKRRNNRAIQEQSRRQMMDNIDRKLTFLSNISHDFKTPLSMILAPVSVMKEKAVDPVEKKNLNLIYENAVKLNNLIHQAIELNQLNQDADELLIVSTFDVVEMIKSIMSSFRESHPTKQFIFDSSCASIYTNADAVKFESIITNLISNASKYSSEDATISCGIELMGNSIQIIVSDDGMGISAKDKPMVYQRMFRAASTSKIKEGNGIGLYLIKRYIELMHGTIEFISQENLGTSFIVTLPKEEADNIQDLTSETVENDNRKKILIVEDNKQIATFLFNLLKSEYRCICAENGRTGLSVAASFLPDLIIMDELMPVMKGTEMALHLKQNPRLVHVPTIMLTAKSDNRTENESVKAGVDIFMSKPFEPAVLKSRIVHLLNLFEEYQKSARLEILTKVKPIEAESLPEKQIAKIVGIIEENISNPDLNVNFLSEKSGLAHKQLYRILKKHMGESPLDYIRSIRLQKAAMLLSQHRFTVTEVCYMVGFQTPSYFTKCFQERYGMPPSQYETGS